MLTERVRASYKSDEIQHHLDYMRQSTSGMYPTHRLLRRYFIEVSKLYRAETEGEPIHFDNLREMYRRSVLGHAAAVDSMTIEDLDDVDLATVVHMHSVEAAEVGEHSMRAAMAPFEHAADYARDGLADMQLEPWYQDVVGQAMWYVNAVHADSCIDTQPDDLNDVSCLGCEYCPRKVIASKLLLPIRQPREFVADEHERRREKRITDALLKTAILNGFTSFSKEEPYVAWLFDEGNSTQTTGRV